MKSLLVLGSSNIDHIAQMAAFPQSGETLHGDHYHRAFGGKGANQAAAAAHSGTTVAFVGAVGSDPSGQRLRSDLASHGVDVTHLREVEGPSGTALITVAASGENTIILDAGANATVTVAPAKASLFPSPADIVVLQAEIPAEANAAALAWAHSFGARVLLNLAPARPTYADFMARVDILVVNETEAGLTLGMPAPASPTEAIGIARALRGLGPKHVMVTLGADGAAWASGSEAGHCPALTLGEAVDTTGAGDACVGALAAAMALGKPFNEAVADGIRAGSTAVLAPGAAPSYTSLPRVTRS